MKNYLLTTLVATIATLIGQVGQADGFRPQILFSDAPEVVVDSLQESIQESHANLARLANNNALVLQRFDQLASSLEALHTETHQLDLDQVKTILDAVDFAAEKHKSQTRKNKAKTPYISHPIGVANNLVTIGEVKDPALIIAALLHDTVEDTQTTFDEISQRFGQEVCGYVRELTDDKKLSTEERKRLQVINASHKSPGAAQIKCADNLYNLNDLLNNPPEGWSRQRIDQYFEWAESVVSRLPCPNPQLKQATSQVINQYWENQA